MKKVMRRIVILWCVIGLGKVCACVHPWLFRIAQMKWPVWDDNSRWDSIPDEMWNTHSIEQSVVVWFWAVVLIALCVAAVFAGHAFTAWLFGEKE